MDDKGQNGARSWAKAEATQDTQQPTVLFWQRLCVVLSVVALIGLGAVGMTLSDSMRTTDAVSKNLELTQRVREIEGTLADVDHIMVQLRLVDAQVKTMVRENQDTENVAP